MNRKAANLTEAIQRKKLIFVVANTKIFCSQQKLKMLNTIWLKNTENVKERKRTRRNDVF